MGPSSSWRTSSHSRKISENKAKEVEIEEEELEIKEKSEKKIKQKKEKKQKKKKEIIEAPIAEVPKFKEAQKRPEQKEERELGEKIWEDISKASGKGFDKIYDLLNIKFHDSLGQSHFEIKGKDIVNNALKNNIAKREKDGAIYVEFQEQGKKELTKKYIC
jgi:arginyl-tRNA synthetase